MRRNPPAVVSPLTPALTMVKTPAGGVNVGLEQSGESFARIEAVTGGEAIAKDDDGFAGGFGDGGNRRRGVARDLPRL